MQTTLYRDNRPLLKVECGITLGLLKLIYSSDASYDGTLLGVKPRLSTESVPCVVTFDSTQLTYSEYDLIVQGNFPKIFFHICSTFSDDMDLHVHICTFSD